MYNSIQNQTVTGSRCYSPLPPPAHALSRALADTISVDQGIASSS